MCISIFMYLSFLFSEVKWLEYRRINVAHDNHLIQFGQTFMGKNMYVRNTIL